jgi:hypothetical protein
MALPWKQKKNTRVRQHTQAKKKEEKNRADVTRRRRKRGRKTELLSHTKQIKSHDLNKKEVRV